MAWDLNKDFYNNTGLVANDIEIYLDGAVAIIEHYDGEAGVAFPVFETFTQDMNGSARTVLRWSGYTVPSGGKMHVGFSATAASIIGWCWTYNGVPIGPVTQMDLQPTLGGLGIQATNTLTYSLWPTGPWTPPPYVVTDVTVYYFPALLPLASLNNAMLPAWTPIGSAIILPPGSGTPVAPGGAVGFSAPSPPPGAVSAVWVVGLNTADPGGSTVSVVAGSTDFVQYDLRGSVPVDRSSWGEIKSMYQ